MTREEAIEVYNGLINKKIKEAFEFFAPELRESEDERIRKAIISLVHENCYTYESFDAVELCDMLSYLEKQKEQKPAEWSYPYGKNETVDRLVSIAECLEMNGDCVYNGYKGDECGVFLRALAREYLCIEELVNVVQDKNLMDILYYASSDDHFPSLRKLHTLLTSYNEQKEQKPNYCHYGGDPNIERCKHCSATCIGRLAEEQKPTATINGEPIPTENNSVNIPLAEWSEEDEKTINKLCDVIASNAKNGYLGGCYAPDLIEKVKSLRPSWKPSEVCYGAKGDPDPAGVCKPSEEQMKTPNKIYMLPEELDERSEWLTKPYEDRDIAYVRTDILLEWANEMENCSQLSAPLLAHELIKKINSL